LGKKRILAIVRVMHAGGGVTLTLWSLLRSIASHTDWEVVLLSAPKTGVPSLNLLRADGVEVHMLKTRRNLLLDKFNDCWAIGFRRALCDVLPEVDLVHFHSLWRYPTRLGCPVLRKAGKPYMITPHGTIDSWALRYRGLRKRAAFAMYERRNLEAAACLHATAGSEAAQMRRLEFAGPVAVLPNGLSEEAFDAFQDVQSREGHPGSSRRRLLFVSRLHPKKRVKELVEAWVCLAPEFPDWELEIVGSGDPRYERDVRKPLQGSAAAERTIFRGYLAGEDLWQTYKNSDLFVLPTHTENFGCVIIEALAAGLPVITTTGTPWAELEKRQCGWWRDIDKEPLTSVLRETMALGDQRRQEMGARGRAWVLGEFSWPAIARRTVAVYDWILNGRKREETPAFVDVAQE